MPGSFFALNIAETALSAAQVMMDVAGQNIANDSTPGYSRQTANLTAAQPFAVQDLGGGSSYPGELGTGVNVQSVTRIRADYLDSLYRSSQGDLGLYSSRGNFLTSLQSLFTEPGASGLGTTVNQFFSDFQALSQNPSDPAARTTVQQDAQALTAQIHSIWQGFQGVAQQATSQATADVQTANTYLQELGQMNSAIATAQSVGTQPNDLLDQRDQLVDKLSNLIGVTAQTTTQTIGNNTISQVQLTIPGTGGAITLLQGGSYGSLALSGGPGGLTLTATDTSGTSTAIQPTSGTIGAAYGLVNFDTNPAASGPPPSIAAQLTSFVQSLSSAVNTQHEAGYYYDTTSSSWQTNLPFFVATGGGAITAANIDLNPVIAQDATKIAAGATAASGDGQNAIAISDIAQNPSGPLSQYNALIAGIGTQVDLSQSLGNTAQSLLNQVTNQRQQVSGVSINEEMTNIVKAQAMYTAAAKVSATADQMLQALVNSVQP